MFVENPVLYIIMTTYIAVVVDKMINENQNNNVLNELQLLNSSKLSSVVNIQLPPCVVLYFHKNISHAGNRFITLLNL